MSKVLDNPNSGSGYYLDDPATIGSVAAPATATVTNIVDNLDGSYDITFIFPRTTPRLFDETGYALNVDIDGESVVGSVLPYRPATGNAYVDIGTINTGSEIYAQYSGPAPVTGDQAVWSVSSIPNGSTITVADTLAWTFAPTVTQNQTSTVYMIAQDGTVGPEDTITWIGAPVSGGNLIKWIKENGTGNSTTEKLLTYLKAAGATQEGATDLLYEFLKANSSKLDHTERYWDVSELIVGQFNLGNTEFPYTLPIDF